ncbi:MAG TPA: chaperonin GroEL, partial [bacterium]|nr:chaperonin GroEL [bacterium]
TNEEAGDGTTTATLLAYELVKRGMSLVDDGVNPMTLRKQIYKVLPSLLEELKKLARDVKSKDDISRVATISSNSEEIGKLVSEAMDKVGKDGRVTVSESSGLDTTVEYTEGMEFDKGYLSQYFITNSERREAVIVNPVVVLIRKKLSMNNEVMPLLERVVGRSKDILLIAEEIKGDALASLVANKMKGIVNLLAVEVPGVGDNKNNYFEDIAILTGATVISDQTATDINKDFEWLGEAERVVAGQKTTVIIGGKGKKEEMEKRLEDLRTQIKEEPSKFEKEKMEERLARLSTGIGVIKVGAKTEIDMRERLEKVKDAIGAATAAREEGIVVGGGSALLMISKLLKGNSEGEKLLKEVLETPARRLMLNSGETNDTINKYIQEILENGELGYEVEQGKLLPLIQEGVIDPAKVVRLALENAISVGCSILTTDALIGIEPEKKNE